MTKTLCKSLVLAAALAAPLAAGAYTKVECNKALKESIAECVKACDGQAVPKKFKGYCKRTACRHPRVKKQFMTLCLQYSQYSDLHAGVSGE